MDNTNLDSDARPDADIRTSPLLDHPADRAAARLPRRRALLAALAACAVLAAAGACIVPRPAPPAEPSPPTAPPRWAVGRFYIPSAGFSELAMSDRYGEGRQIISSSGKWLAAVGAAAPAWWDAYDPDLTRHADETTWSARVPIAKWTTTTLTVRNAAGAVLASTARDDASSGGTRRMGYGLVVTRTDLIGPLTITADDHTERVTITMPIHAVADGTAIRAHALDTSSSRSDLTLRVTDVAAWPGGVALRLEGSTGRPTDRVIVTTARLIGGDPSTVILSPQIMLRDDRGRTYPLLAAESFDVPTVVHWPWSDLEELVVGGDGPPTASIGLPATLRFAPLVADARDVALEVADALVVVDGTGQPASGIARLSPASGTLLTIAPPRSVDGLPRSTKSPGLPDRLWSGGLPIVPVDQAITIGGVRTRVVSAVLQQVADGREGGSDPSAIEVVRLNLAAPPAGSKRFVIDGEAWESSHSNRSVRCDVPRRDHGFSNSPNGDVRIPWPPSISVQYGSDSRYPPPRRVRICIVTPVIAVHDTWTLPLPGDLIVADQRTNGTGATD